MAVRLTCSAAPSASTSVTETALPSAAEKVSEPFSLTACPVGTVTVGGSFAADTVTPRAAVFPAAEPSVAENETVRVAVEGLSLESR